MATIDLLHRRQYIGTDDAQGHLAAAPPPPPPSPPPPPAYASSSSQASLVACAGFIRSDSGINFKTLLGAPALHAAPSQQRTNPCWSHDGGSERQSRAQDRVQDTQWPKCRAAHPKLGERRWS